MQNQDHLAELNEKQKEAATHTKGPLLIVAGAGAGKTKTITHRIVNLIKQGVPPEQILAVTFTNKAAREMRGRVLAEIEKNARGQDTVPFISTFHSLGAQIIKENARSLGFTRHFTILDEGDSTGMVKDALKELGYDPKEYEPRRIKGIISREKGNFADLEEYKERPDRLARVTGQVWELYEIKKAKENSLDFDDLLLMPVQFLQRDDRARKKYQEKWKYIHIDEYQDTNEAQYLLSKILAEKHQNVCAVGDADQNIYSWRGADLKNILSFEKDYPTAKIVLLEENYRSTQNILEAANQVIKKNKFRPKKNLFTKNIAGEKISLYAALDETDEADFVATKILEILDRGMGTAFFHGLASPAVRQSFGRRARGTEDLGKSSTHPSISLSEIAILYRTNFQSRALEEAMLRYNIPYQVLGVKFFERREVKDTLAYLRAALNPDSLSDIRRIINFPRRGVGKVTLAKIFAGEKNTLPEKIKAKIALFYKLLEEIAEKIRTEKPSAVIKFTVKKSGIEAELSSGTEEEAERLENIKELATLALKYDQMPPGEGMEKLLEEAALASDQDSLKNKGETENKSSVKLMTVHAAKGLEFEDVFITGLEQGLFPNERDGEESSGWRKAEDAEEERRLFYVALTRAKKKLYLSYANYRTIFGSRSINAPSEFIYDIPGNLIEQEGEKVRTIYL